MLLRSTESCPRETELTDITFPGTYNKTGLSFVIWWFTCSISALLLFLSSLSLSFFFAVWKAVIFHNITHALHSRARSIPHIWHVLLDPRVAVTHCCHQSNSLKSVTVGIAICQSSPGQHRIWLLISFEPIASFYGVLLIFADWKWMHSFGDYGRYRQ